MRESVGATKPKGKVKAKAAPPRDGRVPLSTGREGAYVGSPVGRLGRTTSPSGRFLREVRRSQSAHVGTRKMVNYARAG